MKNKFILILVVLLIFGCNSSRSFTGHYKVKHKYISGELVFFPDNSYRLKIDSHPIYRESKGTFVSISKNKLVLNSKIQLDSILITKRFDTSTDSISVLLTDFENIPIDGVLLTDKGDRLYMVKGKIKFPDKEYKYFNVVYNNYLMDNADTIKVECDRANLYHIQKVRTFGVDKELFLKNSVFVKRGKYLINVNKSILGHRLRFKYCKDSIY